MNEAGEQRDLTIVLVEGRAEHDSHVVLIQCIGDPGDDYREIRRVDSRNRHPDQAGSTARETACGSTRRIAVLADHVLDGAARFRRNVAAVIYDAGDRRRRDAGDLCDVADRYPLCGSAACLSCGAGRNV